MTDFNILFNTSPSALLIKMREGVVLVLWRDKEQPDAVISTEYSENVEHGKTLVRQNGQQPIS